MRFHYIASQSDGRIVENDMSAEDISEVLQFLMINNLKPIVVRAAESWGARLLRRRRINLLDQIFISKYMALMLKIGTGLLEAINILIADFNKPAVKDVLLEVRSALEQGKSFYSTFAKYPNYFSQVYINMIRAGEASGNLDVTFEDLSQMLAKQKELKDQIRGALTYPILLLVGSILILSFIIIFALPKIAKVFSEGGLEPPLFSRIVFGVGLFLSHNGIYILGFLIVALTTGITAFRRWPAFRKFLFSLFNEIPVIKDVIKKIAIQRFSGILASLIRAGMPLVEAIEVTAQAAGHIEVQESLMRISRDGLAKGLTLGEAFKRESFFPTTVTNLIAISEKAGHLEEVLSTLSDFYVKEIDSSIKALVALLEPVLLVFIGAIIGMIALAIIIPIYQLTTSL